MAAAQALGEYLVKHGLLTRDGLRRALDAQSALECRLGSVVLDLGLLDERTLLRALGRHAASRTVPAQRLADIPGEVLKLVPSRFAVRHQLVPFELNGRTLSVAAIDPTDLLVEDELKQLTDCRIASFIAMEVRVEEALARYYGKQLSVQMSSLLKRLPAAATVTTDQDAETGDVSTVDADDLVDVVPAADPPPKRSYRPGVPLRREPDASMMVELSEDELADFPSLRRALEDSGIGAEAATDQHGTTEPAADVPEVGAEVPAAGALPSDADTAPIDPVEVRLAAAADGMQRAEMREDIADAILGFCEPYLQRRILLAVREGVIMGWRGEGKGIDSLWVRSLSIPVNEPSVFVSLGLGRDHWRGPLLPTAANHELLLGLGGEQPAECIVLPLVVRDKPIGFLYGDNLHDRLDDAPLEPMRRLATKAGLAFQIYMLKNKLRTL